MSRDLLTELDARFLAAMRAALGDELPENAATLIAPSRNPEHGDFQCNAAMGLAKKIGAKPRDVAEKIVAHLRIDDLAEPPDVAGPGFINIRLKPDALTGALAGMDDETLGVEPPEKTETVVVDLCGVNLAKQMHVGHLRATVIGDALARLNERLGHEVVRQNHFGDWGLPIAMVTEAIKAKADAGELDLDALTLGSLEAEYRAAQARCAPDRKGLEMVRKYDLGPKALAELETQNEEAEEHLANAKAALVKLQSGDASYLSVWKRISAVTLEACFDNCARLQANVTELATAGESTYADELAGVIEDLESRSVAVESDGALIVKLDDFGIKEPLLVRKRDGGFLYATTDICGIRRRVQKLGGDRLVYAVDARQSLHFRQVFAASKKAGYAKRPGGADAETIHAAFGTVLGDDGKPFKTRSGENVKLRDLLDEAVKRAEAAVAEKSPELSADERREIAEAVGIGAIKYADLSSDRVKDYVFDFDRMLAFEGNTGPYLQYAAVRIASIFRKAEERFGVTEDSLADAPFACAQPEEKALALELLKYGTALRGASEACEPHRLCTYLYDLATSFSSFFASCPVLGADDEAVRLGRLRLCSLAGRVLRDGLRTIGIRPLDRM
ncbi:MAG: arginine--tRNA ligase [Phycisphaerales bacterium]